MILVQYLCEALIFDSVPYDLSDNHKSSLCSLINGRLECSHELKYACLQYLQTNVQLSVILYLTYVRKDTCQKLALWRPCWKPSTIAGSI